jgi:hypothetical protein
MSLYIEFVGSRHVHRMRSPWITGIGDDLRAMEEKARGVMSWLALSSTVGSSVYRLDPVTMIVQNRKGDSSK